jgi:hypothetical protein
MLFSQMEPPPGWEEEFHDWYESEHIPVRLELPGFARAARFEATQGEPKYLAVYELDDMGVLDTPQYSRLKSEPSARTERMLANVDGFTRFTCAEISDVGERREASFLFVVAFAVPADQEAAFDDWYDSEHAPMLLRADDWLRVRRYRVLSGDGGPWTHFALHELASEAVMSSPERAAAREGPKREQFVGMPWFQSSGRWMYRAIHRAVGASSPLGRSLDQSLDNAGK